MLFVFFPGKILIMGLMCLSCFCVSRGLFHPGCRRSCAPHPRLRPHWRTRTWLPQCLQRVGGAAERVGAAPPSSSPPPPPPQSQTRCPTRGVAEPCQGSWCFWRLQAKTHFKLFEICLPFSRGDGEAGSQGAPSVRPSNLSLTRTSPSDYAPSTYQAGAGCWGTATAWADPHPCLLRVQSGGREEV